MAAYVLFLVFPSLTFFLVSFLLQHVVDGTYCAALYGELILYRLLIAHFQLRKTLISVLKILTSVVSVCITDEPSSLPRLYLNLSHRLQTKFSVHSSFGDPQPALEQGLL